ncbi:hypothetical protein PSPO01_06153 [Paraphaeosphaeria sporulosa]
MLLHIILLATLFCLVFVTAAASSASSGFSLAKALAERSGRLPGRELRASTNIAKLTTRSATPLEDFFEGGEAPIVAKGLGARVDLGIGVSSDGGFDVSVFEIPLLFAIVIRGIGSAGLLYAPALHFAWTLNGTLNFTTGFEIAVPDNSNIFIDLTEPNNSSTSGFDATTVTPVPFQASVDVDDVQLSVALRQQVQIRFNFNNGISAKVDVYLNLPKFGAGLTKKSGVDENYGALASSASGYKDVAQEVFKDVLSIEPSVDWGIGIEGEVSWFGATSNFEQEFANVIFSDVDNQCLVFSGLT